MDLCIFRMVNVYHLKL